MNEDKSFDIIAFELIRSGLSEIAEEMMTTLFRTGRSVNTTQALDCSAGLADAEGQLLVQALALPGHLGTFPGVMEVMFRHFGKAMRRRRHLCFQRPLQRRPPPARRGCGAPPVRGS